MAITTDDPPTGGPRLLDLTRLVSRAGRPMTGVDRVEFAYLTHLLEAGPLYGLVRSSLGFVLLGPEGCRAMARRIETWDFGEPDRLSQSVGGLDPMRARAESDLRRLSLARCLPLRLSRMLRSHLPRGTTYFNTGHTNFTERVLSALRLVPEVRVAVLVHDTIPLDFPEFQRAETRPAFAAFLERAARHADVILCNSQQTARDVARHAAPLAPRLVVAPLGVPQPVPGTPPPGPFSRAPYFVSLGTIEPRKNHALLLDLWPEIEDAHLVICGSRGWENEAVFARLDARPERVHEYAGLADPQVFGLLARSAGLLFPSHVEGFGLPPVEAAALGVPVICNDLPVYREVLGDIPVYAPVSDRYLWRTRINGLAAEHRAGQAQRNGRKAGFAPPTWDAHFKAVLTSI